MVIWGHEKEINCKRGMGDFLGGDGNVLYHNFWWWLRGYITLSKITELST